MDLLTWTVEQWFLAEAFQKAQEEGSVAPDEVFDPFNLVASAGNNNPFPLWLSLQIRTAIAQMYEGGNCLDPVPSCLVGEDKSGHYHGIGYLRLPGGMGVLARSGAKRQHFRGVRVSDLVEEILVFEIWEQIQDIMAGRRKAATYQHIEGVVRQFRVDYPIFSGSWVGELP
ncbi:MAG: hypothetical protein HY681_07345 [Chloroflexi bacterium]|nr:hypothetical protein [Chloroflexota bacterium]